MITLSWACNYLSAVLFFLSSWGCSRHNSTSISQIPQCTSYISHDAPFRSEMYIFLFWMVPFTEQVQCVMCELGQLSMCKSPRFMADHYFGFRSSVHDDVIKWKHFPSYWPFVRGIHRSPHKGQWRGALMFSLISVWINGWVNNRDAGDLRRSRAHYDVIVMCVPFSDAPCSILSKWIWASDM